MKKALVRSSALILIASLPVSAFANASATASIPQVQASGPGETQPVYSRFIPRPSATAPRIDYSHWDEALDYFVFPMGRSLRQGAPSVNPEVGSRIVYGHESRLRLEGNRVTFSFLEKDQIAALTEYRQDLENTANSVDIAALPRNEQLAFWLNLHNVAVIEQLAKSYPVRQPSRLTIGSEQLPLDEAKIVTIRGVALSPRDIRTKIVYPNWRNPLVIYGFFRGEIGGPSIQRKAFAADNIGDLLTDSAYDFVNSLRGTEKRGKTLHVSKIYEEAAPFYFSDWSEDLRAHLSSYSTDQVQALINRTNRVKASIYEYDISDLARGERDPEYGYVVSGGLPITSAQPNNIFSRPIGVPRHIGRLITEKRQKYRKMLSDKYYQGRVVVLTPEELAAREQANRELN